MEARHLRPWMGLATVLLFSMAADVSAQMQRGNREYMARTQNFMVFASSPQWAQQVAQVAEQHRQELSQYWLGADLPPWSEPVPVHVQSGPNLGAGGETRFVVSRGRASDWMMSVQGTPERILDSVLPHEITHTIFATHFAPLGKYVPRWADEGACTTVEHEAEKSKHRRFLTDFLKTGRGLAFNRMFSLKEYPDDILPLYAQGHSAVQFLLDQGGAEKFVQFLEAGMRSEAWETALKQHYAYNTIGEFQTLWNQWLLDGSPHDLTAYAPALRGPDAGAIALAGSAGSMSSAASQPIQFAVGNNQTAPVVLASEQRVTPTGPQPGDPLALGAVVGEELAMSDSVEDLGSQSWYKRRLLEVSGQPATPVPPHNTTARARLERSGQPAAGQLAAGNYSQPQPQAAARQQPVQSTGIQVLDWGGQPPPSAPQRDAQWLPATTFRPIMVPVQR